MTDNDKQSKNNRLKQTVDELLKQSGYTSTGQPHRPDRDGAERLLIDILSGV